MGAISFPNLPCRLPMNKTSHPTALRRRALAASLAALPLALQLGPAWAQAASNRLRFTLDWRVDGPGAIVLLALGRGYFAQEGLDVVIDAGAGSAASVQRIASGTHDIGFADTSALVEYLANNPTSPRLQAVYMFMDQAPSAVFALKKSGILKPADLQGRTVGAPVFDAGRKSFPLFAKANRFDASRVQWTNADPALRETLLIKGDVDAITGFYYTSLLNLQARGVKPEELTILKFADHGVRLYGNSVVVSPTLAAERPQAVQGFLRALNRSIKDCIADPAAGVQYVKARDSLLDAKVEEQRLRHFLENFVATPAVQKAGLGDVDLPRLRSHIVQVSDAFGLKRYVPAEQVFSSAYLPPLKERQL